MNAAAKFEFDIVAEHAIVSRTAAHVSAAAPLDPAQVAAAYQRSARLCSAHAALMRAVW